MSEKKEKKPKDKKASLMGLLRPYRKMVIFLIIFTLLGNGINLVIPQIIAHGIDSFESGNYIVKQIVTWFVAASLFIMLFTYLQNIVQTYASEKVARDLRKKLADKISRQNHEFVQEADPSKLLTNLTSDIDAIKNFVSHAIVSMISSIFIIIGTCVILLTINTKLGLIVISIIPIIATSFYVVIKKVKELYTRSREVVDRLNKVISESIIGSAIIRVLNTHTIEYNKFLSSSDEAKNIGISILKLFAMLIPIITMVSNLAVLAVLALGGKFVINTTMSMGDFAAFNSYITILVFPIIIIGFMSNVVAQASASYKRINTVLQKPDIEYMGTETKIKGDIELKNVWVEYNDKPVLKDISLKIKAGSQTAIIGPTAAGKTQILSLIAGVIPPKKGEVLIDGKQIDEFDNKVFHSSISTVFQESILFNLSLKENIGFGENTQEENIKKAIDTAALDDFIDTLPEHLETIVSERGSSLSGGQKQRIMLARALTMNPKVLLLDDFTARVDRQTENKIECNLLKNYPDVTLLTVTQKVASVKNYDHIILLMEGEIIAQGKHDELLATCPEYNQIHNSQLSTSHYEL